VTGGLTRAARRRLERAVEKLLGADDCTLCGRPLPSGGMTRGGATADGTPAVVGECCAARLAHVVGGGVYLAHDDPVAAYAALAADTAERAGLGGRSVMISVADEPWKCDDRAWFEVHPDRAHRLRPMATGEAPTLLCDPPVLPPRHAWQVLVRQVEPGRRVRIAFGRNLDCPIPDAEAIVHALFDLARCGERGAVLPIGEVAELALRYADAAGQGAH
jgi:hypothetical protein